MRNNIHKTALTGMFAALIFLATYAIHIPLGGGLGYLHFGDAMVYAAASILPLPWAMAASAIGAGLADMFVPGGTIWLPATLIIKPLCCVVFTRNTTKIICRRNVIALFFAALATIGGYGLATMIITGSTAMAVASFASSWIQPLGSSVFYLILSAALDKAKIINRKGVSV